MALVSLPHTFSPNTPIYSGQVNSNYAAIVAQVNGALNEANLASGAVTPSRFATLPRAKCAVTPWTQGPGGGGLLGLAAAEYDTDNMYDDVNDYFTVVTAGVYTVSASIATNLGLQQALYVLRGPGGVLPGTMTPTTVAVAADDNRDNAVQFCQCSGTDYFAAGDRIGVHHYAHMAGGLLSVTVGQFNVVWVSP